MAIEIIGIDELVAEEVSCEGCGSRLRYYKNDIEEGRHCDYGGGVDVYKFIVCECGKKVLV